MDSQLADALNAFGQERGPENHAPTRGVDEHGANHESQCMDIDRTIPAHDVRSKYDSVDWLQRRWRLRAPRAGSGKSSTAPSAPTLRHLLGDRSRNPHNESVPGAKILLNKVVPGSAKVAKASKEDHKYDKLKNAQSPACQVPKRHVLGERELGQALKRGGSSSDQVGVKSNKNNNDGKRARDSLASQQKLPSGLFQRTRQGWRRKGSAAAKHQSVDVAMKDTAATEIHKANI